MESIKDFFGNMFAQIIVEHIWGWFISFAFVAGAITVWHYLATEQPGIAFLVGIGLLSFFVFLIQRIGISRRQKRSSDNEARGLEFFPKRIILEQTHPLDKGIPKATNEYQILSTGRKFLAHKVPDEYLRRIRKIIFPKPDTDSVKYYAISINEEPGTVNQWILKATQKMQGTPYNAEVRWCEQFIQYSIRIGDPEKMGGWVHIEQVLPYSYHDIRPSMTLYKKDFEDIVDEYYRIFNELWEKSEPPPKNINELVKDKKTNLSTFVKLKLEGKEYQVIDSNNISSVTDLGEQELIFNFVEPFKTDELIVDVKPQQSGYILYVSEKTKEHVKIQYHGLQSSVIKITIE
ncbi:MAG: hypothetical protein HY356_07925 [Gammaproteobacteria bacterium]|nr:hypothetical protein [Gammaproteobacteria bacterium]